MSCNPAAFSASALVNCNIDKHCTIFHFGQILPFKELGSRTARNQYGTNYKICILQHTLNIAVRGNECLNVSAKHIIQFFQTLEVNIQNRDVCAHADGYFAGIHANGTAAKNNYICIGSSRNTSEKDTLSAELLFEILGAFLN